MKKLLALILTVFTVANLLCVCIPVGASTETTATDINKNLVVHYDFEGATAEEAMKDKAPAGSTKDDLSIALSNGNTPSATAMTFDLENGTVKRGDIWAKLTAAASDDVLALTDKATVFLRFKLPKLDANYPLLDLYNTTDNVAQARFQTNGTGDGMTFVGGYRAKTGYLAYAVSTIPMRTTETYINLAVTIDVKATANADGTYTGDLHYYGSVGDLNENTAWPGNWTKAPVNDANTLPAATDNFAFSVLGYATTAGKMDVILDDVRIYDRVLSLDEVKSIRLEKPVETNPNVLESVGMQCSKTAGSDSYSARFIGVIDTLDADAVGFKVSATYNDGTKNVTSAEKTYMTTSVYTSIVAGSETIVPDSKWGCKYIAVLPINNIPDSYGNVTFTVTAITVVDGVTTYGATQTYTVNAGVEVK